MSTEESKSGTKEPPKQHPNESRAVKAGSVPVKSNKQRAVSHDREIGVENEKTRKKVDQASTRSSQIKNSTSKTSTTVGGMSKEKKLPDVSKPKQVKPQDKLNPQKASRTQPAGKSTRTGEASNLSTKPIMKSNPIRNISKGTDSGSRTKPLKAVPAAHITDAEKRGTRGVQGTSSSRSKVSDSQRNSTSTLPSKRNLLISDKEKVKNINGTIKSDEANHGGGDGKRLSRERTRTRTLSPGDSKLLTALHEAAQQLPKDVEPAPEHTFVDDHQDYEDDFEDYESDFEELSSSDTPEGNYGNDGDNLSSTNSDEDDFTTSSESEYKKVRKESVPVGGGKIVLDEEKKMDSGHYDMADSSQQSRKTHPRVQDIKMALERENSAIGSIRQEPQKISSEQSADSNFEVNFINFAQAKKSQQKKKVSNRMKQRGDVLLNMIHLDFMTFTLFDMAPVPYEIYMKSYGRSNTQQVYSQTNEDGLAEEAQTEIIAVKNKCTQHPPAIMFSKDPSVIYPQCFAVATDPEEEKERHSSTYNFNFNAVRLEQFLLSAGQVILSLLEESSNGSHGLLRNNKVDLGFSQGFTMLNMESLPFLANRPVSFIRFLPHNANSLLTVHATNKEAGIVEDLPSESISRCILCVWSVLHPSQPIKLMVSSSDVTACTFHHSHTNLLFTGLMDGLLSVWDLKERSMFQCKVKLHEKEWSLQSPTYTTGDQLGTRHNSAVVGVQVLDKTSITESDERELAPSQICSLDESGMALIWTVLSGSRGGMNAEDVGLAPWGCVRLVLSSSFMIFQHVKSTLADHLSSNLQCSCLDVHDSGHMYVPTNTGNVVHCLKTGSRVHPNLYRPSWDTLSAATCISVCPFGLPYFLVGCSDGTIRLHTEHSDKPLLSVAGSGGPVGYGPQIISVQWSNTRPCVFFALDEISRLHVWDLGASDMYPLLTVPFKGRKISTMQLSPVHQLGKSSPYLALGTSCGKVKVHLIKAEFGVISPKETTIELDKFKRYVTIL